MKMVLSFWKIVGRYFKILNIELPHDSAILLSGLYLREMNAFTLKMMCTRIFRAVLFRGVENQNNLVIHP